MVDTKPRQSLISAQKRNVVASTNGMTANKRRRQDVPLAPVPLNGSRSSSTPSAKKTSNTREMIDFNALMPRKGTAEKRRTLSNGSISTFSAKKQKIQLSPEQEQIRQAVVNGRKNVFFTGSAGTGKSVLLREIIASLKDKYSSRADAVAVTASTGLAACNVGGTTVHSFAGIGIGDGSTESLLKKVRKNRKAYTRWMRTEALVIDEVSMLDGKLFDMLNKIAKAIRNKDAPFGGIQVILTGDFFQLPPVAKNGMAKFAFEAESWPCIHETYNLKTVFRQKDQHFIDMLNEMRFGTLSAESIRKFSSLSRKPEGSEYEPTELFPMRHEVENANSGRLNSLKTETQHYEARDIINQPQDVNAKLLEHLMAPKKLTLKIGAQVMLIKNMEQGVLVNGSIGTVVGFGPDSINENDDIGEFDFVKASTLSSSEKDAAASAATVPGEKPPVVEFKGPDGSVTRQVISRHEFKIEINDELRATRHQYPLILSWSMSIHKSQGQTLERVKVDLGKIFEKGQAYVALSRCTSMEGLQVLRFNASKVQAHPRVIAWSKTLKEL